MMNAKNRVIAGDYKGKKVVAFNDKCAYISLGFWKQFVLTNGDIRSYEILGEQSKQCDGDSSSSGLIDGILSGSDDVFAELSEKKEGLHIMALEFSDGKKSLLNVDDAVFNAILATCRS